MLLRVEGQIVSGLLKTVDTDKQTITIAIPTGRREPPEEKTFSLAKDARIVHDGNPTTLANLRATDNGPMIQLRLSLDQSMVQSVVSQQIQPRQ